MDPTYEYLWAAGYNLPPNDRFWQGGEPVGAALSTDLKLGVFEPAEVAPRRGKKAAKAKRSRAKP
jgi:hypothetical protein